MQWSDIRWEQDRIVIPVTKTKMSRTIDMSSKLRGMLMLVPEKERVGFVVPDVKGAPSRRDRMQTLIRFLRKVAVAESSPVPPERIGWNAWRHTFATLLVQEGESLDVVSTLMGNTPGVCRRHYAQFMPRDKRLSAIDKL